MGSVSIVIILSVSFIYWLNCMFKRIDDATKVYKKGDNKLTKH